MSFGRGGGHWMFGMGHRGHGHDHGEGWGGPGGMRGMGGMRGRGGGHGRRKLFDGGELRLILLALLAEQPRHGYDLIREIEERTGGGYAPSPGVVYPLLSMLDEMDHIAEVKEEGARRRYGITDAGRAFLEEKKDEAEALMVRLAQLDEASGRADHAPIRRAMMSLHMALRESLHAGESERAHQIADILDEATRKIERL